MHGVRGLVALRGELAGLTLDDPRRVCGGSLCCGARGDLRPIHVSAISIDNLYFMHERNACHHLCIDLCVGSVFDEECSEM